MSFLTEKPFGIVYNFPLEHHAIAAELWRRDIPLTFINPAKFSFDASQHDMDFSLLFNDVSTPSGFPFQNEFVQSLITYNRHVELTNNRFAQGRIINGSAALDVLVNRARQVSLFASLGVRYPKTIIATNLDSLITQVHALKFPILIKNSDVSLGNKVQKFDSISSLLEAIFEEKIFTSNHLLLAQEYHFPKGDQVYRVDTLNGKYLSAHIVSTIREPALSWEVELKSEPFEPSEHVIHTVEQIARAARVDIGSIEYFVDRKTNALFYYNILPFNYRKQSDAEGNVINQIANYVERRLHKIREVELAL
jgi:hypothetical protein